MPKIVNVPDFFKIGLMSFIAIWGINKVLDKFGMSQFKS